MQSRMPVTYDDSYHHDEVGALANALETADVQAWKYRTGEWR